MPEPKQEPYHHSPAEVVMNGVVFFCSVCGAEIPLDASSKSAPLKQLEAIHFLCTCCNEEAMTNIRLFCSQCNEPIQILPAWYNLSPLAINEWHACCIDSAACKKRLLDALVAESLDDQSSHTAHRGGES